MRQASMKLLYGTRTTFVWDPLGADRLPSHAPWHPRL